MQLKNLAAVALAAAAFVSPSFASEGFKPVFGLGVTTGGDTLVTVTYTNGSTQKVKSGGLVHVFGGVEYVGTAFAVQANGGYHVDDSNAKNGSVRFSRYPVELLGFWRASENWRIGGGLRKALDPKIDGSGEIGGQIGNVKFESKAGPVLHLEYAAGNFGIYGRFVAEKYTVGREEVSGNHGGIGFTFRFF